VCVNSAAADVARRQSFNVKRKASLGSVPKFCRNRNKIKEFFWSTVFTHRSRISEQGANPTTFELTTFTTCQRCSRLQRFSIGEKNILKTRNAISCVVNFYNAGVVTRDRRIGSSPCASRAIYLGNNRLIRKKTGGSLFETKTNADVFTR
jgi:hypothetical protein